MNTIQAQARYRWKVLTVFLVLIAICSVSMAAGSAVAQDGGPPEIPAAYYGNITIDDEPAEAGVNVTARIDGEVRGSIVTEQEGAYGGPSGIDRKLTVDGTEPDDEGKSVAFFVDGEPATTDTEVTWESEDNKEVNLAITTNDGTSGGDNNGDSSGGTGGSTAGGGGGDGSTDNTENNQESTDDEVNDDSNSESSASDMNGDDTDSEEEATEENTTDTATEDGTPGFTGLTAFVAFGVVIGFAVFRLQRGS